MSETLTPAAAADPIVATPAHVSPATPVVAETPVTPVPAQEAPAAEAVKTEEAPAAAEPTAEVVPEKAEVKLHTDKKSLLEETTNETKPEGDKTEAKPEAAQQEQPKTELPPVNYEFTLPEGATAPAEQIGAYTDVLREHGVSPDVGQKLLDMHMAHVQRLQEDSLAAQHEAFAKIRADWQEQIKTDPMLGGNGFETTKKAVARARDLIVPESDRAAFNEFLTVTGAGDHPAFWRALYRVANLYDEPAVPAPTARPSPTANPEPRNRGVMGLFDRKSDNSFSSR